MDKLKSKKKCAVPGCLKSLNVETLRYFEIPSNACRRAAWIEAIFCETNLPETYSKNPLVCSQHFKPDDLVQYTSITRLKVSAVPSRHLPTDPLNISTCHSKPNEVEPQNEVCPAIPVACIRIEVETNGTKASKVDARLQDRVIMKNKKCIHLKSVNKNLQNCLRMTQMKLQEYETKMKTLQDNYDSVPEARQLTTIYKDALEGNATAIYIMDQVRNYGLTATHFSWSEKTLRNCSVWRKSFPRGYEHARSTKLINAPCRSTLAKFTGNAEHGIGVSTLATAKSEIE